ncbi:MAG: biotin-dependent carboxyltransferase family protein [Actinomycetota bacterium]
MSGPVLVVEAVGPLATIQDLGRPGHGALGVTASGAADRPAYRLGNRIVGNPQDSASIEVLFGGLVVRATGPVTVAVTGAPVPLHIDERAAPLCTPLTLRAGQLLVLGMPVTGLRSYVAVRGGIESERVFGSASTDPTSGVGPAPLEIGRALAIGCKTSGPLGATDVAAPSSPHLIHLVLRAVIGPRDDWFAPEALQALAEATWTVTADSDRVGIRLKGPSLERSRTDELPSEGVVRGGIQVPASGQPLIFFADHPTTGGYPVIAVVLDEDTDELAQTRPGDRIRFFLRRPPLL